MTEPGNDFEGRFGREYRAYIERGIGNPDPKGVAARVTAGQRRVSRRPGPGRGVTGTLAVAVVALFIALSLRTQPPSVGSASPSLSLPTATPIVNPTQAASFFETPGPTPFSPTAWELRALPPPPNHADFVVHGSSPDGQIVIFQDPSVFDHVYVERVAGVSEILVPGHEVGTPMSARLSPNGTAAIVDEANHLWRYDIGSGHISALPDAPGASALDSYAFISESTVAVLTGPIEGPIGGAPTNTELWVLDLTSGTYTRLGTRHNAILLYPTELGIVVVVDESARHDNTGWHLYLIGSDGGDRLLYDASGAGWVAIAPNCQHVSVSRGDSGSRGTTLVDLATKATTQVSTDGMVQTFSPDGLQFEVLFETDNHAEAFSLNGARIGTIPNGAAAAWVGISVP
jgi:hypothetical protein